MARSSRSTTASRRSARRSTSNNTATTTAVTTTPARTREAPVRATRSIKNYAFEYQRDQVSRRAGASYFRILTNPEGDGFQMTLQEAQSLYNFLGNALNR